MLEKLRELLPDNVFHGLRKIKKVFQRQMYKGNDVHCVCCGSSFKKFAPFGTQKWPNRLCINCDSLERDRLLFLYLDNKTTLYKQQTSLLHIAPERIFFNKFKTVPGILYYPVDKFYLSYPKGTAYLDLLDNNIPDNTYDAIICNHVFQYIEEDHKAMKEVYRMLKPGGWAILQVPMDMNREKTYEDPTITDPKMREKVFGLNEHVRWYGRDYASRLEQAGFKVKEDDYVDTFSDKDIARLGFWKGSRIHYCEK
jgi:SAM-dependent methyltransferase